MAEGSDADAVARARRGGKNYNSNSIEIITFYKNIRHKKRGEQRVRVKAKA